MLQLRLVVPNALSQRVTDYLVDDERLTNVVVLPGASLDPRGDAVSCDVAREAASDVIGRLRELGLDTESDSGGTVALADIAASPCKRARDAEHAAPGSPDDSVVWDVMVDRAEADARSSWSFYSFLTLAIMIASVAVITDSSVLVVGAMVVGPEFGPVTSVATGLALRQPRLSVAGLRLLVLGFVAAILLTTAMAEIGHLAGWIHAADVSSPRPFTGFIWHPDKWSFVVALLAGCVGTLSQAGGRTNTLVGVFISVTTVPAAGNLALAIATWVPREMTGAAEQLGINLVGMTVAGTITLLVLRAVRRSTALREAGH